MGNIVHPQKKEFKGPWILNQEDFESLNIVIKKIDNLLIQSWNNKILKEVQQKNKEISEKDLNNFIEENKKNHWNRIHNKKCEVTSNNGSKLNDETILGILKDKTLETLDPKSFSLNINHGGIYENGFELSISNLYKGSLSYDIKCSDTFITDEIQYEIERWINKRKPSWALNIWSNYSDILLFTLIVPIFFFGYLSFSSSYTTYNEAIRLEMYKIGQEGINDSNRDLALELLIKSESQLRPDNFELIEKPNNPVWIRLFIATIFLYIASFFRPKTIIGLGIKKRKLVIYNFWIKFVLITLPAILIFGPLWQIILTWFY